MRSKPDYWGCFVVAVFVVVVVIVDVVDIVAVVLIVVAVHKGLVGVDKSLSDTPWSYYCCCCC